MFNRIAIPIASLVIVALICFGALYFFQEAQPDFKEEGLVKREVLQNDIINEIVEEEQEESIVEELEEPEAPEETIEEEAIIEEPKENPQTIEELIEIEEPDKEIIEEKNSIPEDWYWKSYSDNTFGFEIKYPSFYQAASDYNNFKRFKYNNTNFLNIRVFENNFNQYQLRDTFKNITFIFDTDQREWIGNSGLTPIEMGSFNEAYLYKTGDLSCNWEYVIIPFVDYSYVVEIINTTCDELVNQIYQKPEFMLNSYDLINNFKFKP